MKFIIPHFFEDKPDAMQTWTDACVRAEQAYFDLLDGDATPQEARTVLPNSTAAEIVMSGNYREWRHILRLRTAKDVHPQMREVMCLLGGELKRRIPVIFDDCVTKWRE